MFRHNIIKNITKHNTLKELTFGNTRNYRIYLDSLAKIKLDYGKLPHYFRVQASIDRNKNFNVLVDKYNEIMRIAKECDYEIDNLEKTETEYKKEVADYIQYLENEENHRLF
jgi:hypothetical protein